MKFVSLKHKQVHENFIESKGNCSPVLPSNMEKAGKASVRRGKGNAPMRENVISPADSGKGSSLASDAGSAEAPVSFYDEEEEIRPSIDQLPLTDASLDELFARPLSSEEQQVLLSPEDLEALLDLKRDLESERQANLKVEAALAVDDDDFDPSAFGE